MHQGHSLEEEVGPDMYDKIGLVDDFEVADHR